MTVDAAERAEHSRHVRSATLVTKGDRMRQTIGLGQLRNSAAYYFDRVAAGESFDVVRRGRMVAQIVPLAAPTPGDSDTLHVDRDGD